MKSILNARRMACLLGCAAVLATAPASLWAQATIEGQVTNGTTNRPVSGAKVFILQPRQGMQQVATTFTDARGHFVFPSEGIDPQSFYLLQSNFQDVPYHAPVPFSSGGKAEINLTVYESTRKAPALRVRQARVLLRAAGSKMDVEELFALQNPGERTFVDTTGTFHFKISPGAGEPRAAVAGEMNMPLPQATLPGKQPGEFSIVYPLKPGLTVVMVGYQSDYSSAEFKYGDGVPYPIEHAEMDVLPATLGVTSDIFKPAGSDADSGGTKFLAEGVPADAALAATLSGEAAPESAANPPDNSEEQVKVTPNATTRLALPLLACFLLLLLWALGVRMAKELPRFRDRQAAAILQHKEFGAKADQLFSALADLDELFSQGKIVDKKYWKERLELKARLMALVKKSQALSPETYAARGPRR